MNVLQNALLAYAIFVGYILTSKPALMFNKDGTMRQYGSGHGKTLVSFPMVCVIGGLMIYSWLYSRR